MPQIFKGKKRKEKQIEFSCLCWTCLEVRKTECLKLFNTCPQSVEDFKTLNDFFFFFFRFRMTRLFQPGEKIPLVYPGFDITDLTDFDITRMDCTENRPGGLAFYHQLTPSSHTCHLRMINLHKGNQVDSSLSST